jgi:excinuclease UvrABC ATPase subunit
MIGGLTPTIFVDQQSSAHIAPAAVGTTTEMHD